MRKILITSFFLTLFVISCYAQIEVTPDMIWREGVEFLQEEYEIDAILDDDYNELGYDTIGGKFYSKLVIVPVEGINYLVNRNTSYGSFAYSYRREDNGKIYGYKFHLAFDGRRYASGDIDNITLDKDGKMGKEYLMHDFNTWVEGDTVEWITVDEVDFYNQALTHHYYVRKNKIDSIERLISPDGKFFLKAYRAISYWGVEYLNVFGLGTIESVDMTFNDQLSYLIPACNFVGLLCRTLEVRSPEGEIYFRHPDYTPEDELGAVSMVKGDEHVNISCYDSVIRVTAQKPVNVDVFTTMGSKVVSKTGVRNMSYAPGAGLYIVRAGETVRKVAIK